MFRQNGDDECRPDCETIFEIETFEEEHEGSFHVWNMHEKLRRKYMCQPMQSIENVQRMHVRRDVLARNNRTGIKQLRYALLWKRLLRRPRWIA